jgi:hypothetical protein
MKILKAVSSMFMLASSLLVMTPYSKANDVTNYPAQVLDGVEFNPLNTYSNSPLTEEQIIGSYFSENGGVVAELSIVKSQSGLMVTRTFSEPGAKPKTKIYKNMIKGGDGSFRTDEAVLRTSGSTGILFLELQSEIEFIPNSFWIYYSKK